MGEIRRLDIGKWLLCAVLLLATMPLRAVAWLPFGPDGGDVRSLAGDAANPAHIYMGTANGWIYESNDGGALWKRLARVGNRDDLVLDHIVVDASNPRHILVGAWVLDHPDGGLYESQDGGRTWMTNVDLAGQSVRALTVSPSDAKVLVAGALSGVYRSTDGGTHWERISPEGSTEIHEIESLAVDTKDPQVIYAGTWHLPWKTTDGGAHWVSIKDGVIEDSDVFSIILDRRDSQTVYASACSGIYKSDNGGGVFKKVQGIPATARRTRVLMQDPAHPDTVFAGTTEGLFRTSDAGQTWLRVTRPEDIINDIYIDPQHTDHMLIATDRGGVLASEDGGFTYRPANRGFSARHLEAYAAEQQNPAKLYVGVVNDKDYGGVFVSVDGGISWAQRADGLHGLDVFALTEAPDNTLIAGTNHGIFLWRDPLWQQYGAPATYAPAVDMPTAEGKNTHPKSAGKKQTGKATAAKPAPAKRAVPAGNDGVVYALLTRGNDVYAATAEGIMVSSSSGAGWRHLAAAGTEPWRFLAAGNSKLLAAGLKRMEISDDNGKSWKTVKRPAELTQIAGVAVDDAGELWTVGGEGIFFSEDDGGHWKTVPKLTLNDVNSIYYDAAANRLLVTDNNASTFACAIAAADKTSQCWDTGWHLRLMRPVGDHLAAATLYDGFVVQPRMVDSPLQ
jgi:photosystem II stability/assembly factor-like uncharacterized protein